MSRFDVEPLHDAGDLALEHFDKDTLAPAEGLLAQADACVDPVLLAFRLSLIHHFKIY